MKRTSMVLLAMAVLSMGAAGLVDAHECTYDGDGNEQGNEVECHETPVVENWRDGNYVPLFDIADRDDEQQRRDAQRWRDECQGFDANGNYQDNQQCAWAEGGTSLFADEGDPHPNELHAGFAASHCFLFEFAHDCSDHDARRGEGVHDAHGGATYVDVCLTANAESKWCDDGMTDTQAGLTVMDHNACGTIIPIVACTDEYHVIRPFDAAYTEEQMSDSAAYIPRIIEDPELYLCGYRNRRSSNPICPRQGDGPLPGSGGGATIASQDATRMIALRATAVGELLRAGVSPDLILTALDAATGPASKPSATAGSAWLGALILALAALGSRVARVVTR